MNAYETAVSLGLTGTDEEIVSALKATGVTNRSIDRATLMFTLNMRGMLTKVVGNNSDEKWVGKVLAMQEAIVAVGTDQQKAGIRLWLSHITNPTNEKWDTTVIEFSAAFWQMFQIFADQPGMPTTADFQALADLGGGWKFANLTVEQFVAQKAAAEIAVALDLVVNLCAESAGEASRQSGASLASIKAAVIAALGS
jgi:hypothetical protein